MMTEVANMNLNFHWNDVEMDSDMMYSRMRSPAAKKSSTKPSPLKVATYTSKDILSGRGGLANKHSGNRVFRRLVRHNKELYKQLQSKKKQDLLIKSIVLAVKSHGARFLKQDKDTKTWVEISDKEAFAKTSQALREPDKVVSSRSSVNDSSSDCGSSQAASQDGSDDYDELPEYEEQTPIPPPARHHLSRQFTDMNPPAADPSIFGGLPTEVDIAPPSMPLSFGMSSSAYQAPTELGMTATTFYANYANDATTSAPPPMAPPQQETSWCAPPSFSASFSVFSVDGFLRREAADAEEMLNNLAPV